MKLKDPRRLIRYLCYRYPKLVKKASLSPTERKVLDRVHALTFLTSKDIALDTNTSIQQASNILLRLFKKGYLERTECVDPTGGIIWLYNAVK